MTEHSAEKEPTDCPCGHAVMWHHERRGCGYHGYSDRDRCRCLRTVEQAVRQRMAQAWAEGYSTCLGDYDIAARAAARSSNPYAGNLTASLDYLALRDMRERLGDEAAALDLVDGLGVAS